MSSLSDKNNDKINLGLLETCIPLSSILTASLTVGFILPRHQTFGLFLLVWWWMAVVVSLGRMGNDEGRRRTIQPPTKWSTGDGSGIACLVGCNMVVLGMLWMWFHHKGKRNGSKRLHALKPFVLQKIPLWCMTALHIYRLDGLSLVMAYKHGKVPTFIGFQTIVLDVWMGATAIPFTFLLHPQWGGGVDRLAASCRLRDAFWLWNSLGLYDLCSAYVILIANWIGVGGAWITEPPLSRLGFHPFPLLILFQVPLAIGIHVLCLTQMDALIEQQQSPGELPLHVRRLRLQKY